MILQLLKDDPHITKIKDINLQVQLYMLTVLATKLCERIGIRKFYHSSFSSIDVLGGHACSNNGGYS